MKRHVFCFIIVIFCMLTSIVAVHTYRNSSLGADLTMQNIEALSQGEQEKTSLVLWK